MLNGKRKKKEKRFQPQPQPPYDVLGVSFINDDTSQRVYREVHMPEDLKVI